MQCVPSSLCAARGGLRSVSLVQQELRQENRERSIEAIRKVREEQNTVYCGTQQVTGDNTDGDKKQGKLRAISVHDEAKLLKYYATKIQDISRALGLPHKVQATALIFLKRAYLCFSALDHDPKNVMLTCIYLAGKVEESYIGAEQFCRVLKQEESVVLRGELLLLEALNYDLIIYTPYRALQGFCIDLEAFKSGGGQQLPPEKLKQIKAKAQGAVDVLMLTDAPLLFPPGQLALAALRSGLKNSNIDFEAFAEHVLQKSGESSSLPALTEALHRIDSLGVEGSAPVNEQEVRKIDRKLKQCHNVLLDPSSKEYEKAAADRQYREDMARAEKAAARRAQIVASKAVPLSAEELPLQTDGEEHPTKRQRA